MHRHMKVTPELIDRVRNGSWNAKDNAGEVLDNDHGDWYRALFGPSVVSGLLKPADLAGYRNHQVYITNSMHFPFWDN